MHVFVRRSDLKLTADEAVQIQVYFEDGAFIPPEMDRPDFARLTVSAATVEQTMLAPVLAQGWRESNKRLIASGEAERRILEAFPDYAQRNSAAELMGYLAVHGAPASAWPAAAQKRKAEIDRAWAYVDAVRRAARGMAAGALPADPTVDKHWPAKAAAYQPG